MDITNILGAVLPTAYILEELEGAAFSGIRERSGNHYKGAEVVFKDPGGTEKVFFIKARRDGITATFRTREPDDPGGWIQI